PRQLTSDPGLEAQPQLLPDGKRILFSSRASGTADVQIRAIDLDGGNPRTIATGGIQRGRIQAVGDHVYFKVWEGGRSVDYRVPLAGGPRAPLFADATRLPRRFILSSVSPDERWAVGTYAEPPASGMAVVAIDGSAPARK